MHVVEYNTFIVWLSQVEKSFIDSALGKFASSSSGSSDDSSVK